MSHFLKTSLFCLFIFNANIYAKNKSETKDFIVHFFNRLSFGPSNDDISFALKHSKTFKEDWLNEQMNPDKIDDLFLDSKLHQIKSLDMEPKDNLTFYKKPEELARELKIPIDETDSKKDIRKEVRESIGNSRFPEALILEMQSQKMIRAIESKKQLQEVLVDFWFNYFNIDIGKNDIKYFAYDYENNVIRKNVFKSFKDLLSDSAHHPAMLVYLDNRQSRANAINENYAREIMELHTLGVDGGYSQNDVQELARILTGWTTSELKVDPQFNFKKNLHDKNEKNWLGIKFVAGGDQAEGEKALDVLANHPKTAEHVCKKLIAHFISENNLPNLLNRCSKTFMEKKGDLKSIYSTLFLSEEFSDLKNYRSKIKKPFHLIASSVRALGGEVINPLELIKAVKNMGEELYRCAPPTGYKDDASSWVNPGAMISRLQFALDLSSQKIPGVLIAPSIMSNNVNTVAQSIGIAELSKNSLEIISHELESESKYFRNNEIRPTYMAKLTGMILGSPEFQRR